MRYYVDERPNCIVVRDRSVNPQCHEAELGVCEQHCDVVKALKAKLAELEAWKHNYDEACRSAFADDKKGRVI